jgi:hypothetical protein
MRIHIPWQQSAQVLDPKIICDEISCTETYKYANQMFFNLLPLQNPWMDMLQSHSFTNGLLLPKSR